MHSLSRVDYTRNFGTDADYSSALNSYIKLLDRWKEIDDELYDESIMYQDKMISLVWLSRLETKLGNLADADTYMKQAMSICKDSGLKICQSKKLLEYALTMEKYGYFYMLKNETN